MSHYDTHWAQRRPRKSDLYDWCDKQGECRTPEEYPYGYSAYYVWRRGVLAGSDISCSYSDHLAQRDSNAWAAAHKVVGRKDFKKFSVTDCNKFLAAYFGDGSEIDTAALAMDCNQSSGFPIAVFFYRKKS